MPRSDQYKAFQRRYSYLRDTLNPTSFAPKAFEEGLLSKSERNAAQCDGYPPDKKNDKILEGLERRILANSSAFDKLLEVLRDIDNGDEIAKKLEASLEEVRNTGPGRSPARTPPPPSRTPPPPSRTPPPQSYGGAIQIGAVCYSSVQPPPGQSYTSLAEPLPVPPPASLRETNTWHTGHTHTSMHPPPRGLANYTPYTSSEVPHPPPAGLEGYVSSEGYTNPAFRSTSAGATNYTQPTGYTDPAFHPSPASAEAINYTQPTGYQHSASDPHPSLSAANYAEPTRYHHSASDPPPSLDAANYAQPTGYQHSASHPPPSLGSANYAQPTRYQHSASDPHPSLSGANYAHPTGYQHSSSNPSHSLGGANYAQPTGSHQSAFHQVTPSGGANYAQGAGYTHPTVPGHLSMAYQPSDGQYPPSSTAPPVPAPTPPPTGARVAMAYQPSDTHHPLSSAAHPTGAGVAMAYQPSDTHHPPSSAAHPTGAGVGPSHEPSQAHLSSATLQNTSPTTVYQPSDAHHPPSSAVHIIPARASHPAEAGVEAYRSSHAHSSTAALPNASPTTVYQPSDAHHPPSNVASTVAAPTSHPTGAGVAKTSPPTAEPISQPPTGPLSWEPSTGRVIAQATPSLQPAHAPLSNVQEGRQENPFAAGVQESGGNQETHAPVQESQPGVSEPQARAEEPRPHVSEARAGVQEAGGSQPQAGVQEAGGSGVQEAHPQAAVEETQRPGDASRGPVVGLDRAWFQNDGVMGQLVIDGGEELGVIRFAAYKDSESKKCKAVSLSFESVKVKRKKKDEHNPYPMKCSPHGIAVIINNEQFVGSGLSKRTGTAVDEENLVQTFRYLRYNVELYRNCTRAQVLEIFQKVQERDHTMYDSFVCCILTHGKQGIVYGSDSRPIELSEVAAKLEARNCASLANKPKMFFIQACRGTIQDPAVRRVTIDGPEARSRPVETDGGGNKLAIPNQADFLFSYATPLGHVAIRHTDFGSWYISELCHALCHSSTHLRLNDMLTDAHNEVGNYSYPKQSETNPAEEVECRQACEFTSRLRGNVYFF